MKNFTTVKRRGSLLFATGILVATTFVACKQKKKAISNTQDVVAEVAEEIHTVDKSLFENWKVIRSNADSVKQKFAAAGNYFEFEVDSLNVATHAHIGYDVTTNSLSFTMIKANSDTPENTTCIALAKLQSQKIKLPKMDTIAENNKDAIGWNEANIRINNWRDDAKRNQWIDSNFNKDVQNEVFTAFYISKLDFKYGDRHRCYLALRDVKENGITVAYKPDLIILNTETSELLTLKAKGNLEDLTQPVPPYPAYLNMSSKDMAQL